MVIHLHQIELQLRQQLFRLQLVEVVQVLHLLVKLEQLVEFQLFQQ
tara:strand:+ start:77 stop:214 length:138 start_codon:yes stop_codon:yes gene_type:complete